jgi:hypothetical protein
MIRFDDDDLPGFGFDASDDELDALVSRLERDAIERDWDDEDDDSDFEHPDDAEDDDDDWN